MASVADQLYLQAIGFREKEAGRVADMQKGQAGAEYDFARPLVAEQNERNVFDVNSQQEGRGMLRSGDTGRRLENVAFDTEADYGKLALDHQGQMTDIESTLITQMGGYGMDRAGYQASMADKEARQGLEAEQHAFQIEQQNARLASLAAEEQYWLDIPTPEELLAGTTVVPGQSAPPGASPGDWPPSGWGAPL